MRNRVKLISLVATFEYSDGTQKVSDIDVNENEAFFWSENSVVNILGKYYAVPRQLSSEESAEFSKSNGFTVQSITPEVVSQMWESSVTSDDAGDLPIGIQKTRRSIPVVSCKRCHANL